MGQLHFAAKLLAGAGLAFSAKTTWNMPRSFAFAACRGMYFPRPFMPIVNRFECFIQHFDIVAHVLRFPF